MSNAVATAPPLHRTVSMRWALLGFAGLLVADVIVKLLGFRRLHAAVQAFPRPSAPCAADERVAAICHSINRAAAFYFKRAWCLQRSAVTTCLLRLLGYPAEMIIGVRKMPFYAHAWVEIDGRVVNDARTVQSFYVVLERC
ncbi:MAG TPA: lasso peptide biosynthesis B2 protein [Thermoanaerobaculia bacterium]